MVFFGFITPKPQTFLGFHGWTVNKINQHDTWNMLEGSVRPWVSGYGATGQRWSLVCAAGRKSGSLYRVNLSKRVKNDFHNGESYIMSVIYSPLHVNTSVTDSCGFFSYSHLHFLIKKRQGILSRHIIPVTVGDLLHHTSRGPHKLGPALFRWA